jgi:hypothetical protein
MANHDASRSELDDASLIDRVSATEVPLGITIMNHHFNPANHQTLIAPSWQTTTITIPDEIQVVPKITPSSPSAATPTRKSHRC